MSNLIAQAKEQGVSTKIPIGSDIRLYGCNASYAQLTSIEGGVAIYRGICDNQHQYEIRVQLNKKKQEQEVHIDNNGLQIGEGEKFEATGLEEY